MLQMVAAAVSASHRHRRLELWCRHPPPRAPLLRVLPSTSRILGTWIGECVCRVHVCHHSSNIPLTSLLHPFTSLQHPSTVTSVDVSALPDEAKADALAQMRAMMSNMQVPAPVPIMHPVHIARFHATSGTFATIPTITTALMIITPTEQHY